MRILALFAVTTLVACDVPDEPEGAFDTFAAFDEPLPPPGVLGLTVPNPILAGQVAKLIASGATSGESVQYYQGATSSTSAGPCPSALGGLCLDLGGSATLTATKNASSAGKTTWKLTVPVGSSLIGRNVCFQVAAPRTAGNAIKSSPVCVLVQSDADGDGVYDSADICAGHDDFFDWDMDGTPDGCDATGPKPAVITRATLTQPFSTGTFQTKTFRSYIPANPTGIVWMFHGTSGSSEFIDSPEATLMLNAYVARGFGYVAFDSDNRSTKRWNSNALPATNADWLRLDAYRDQLIANGTITSTTPMFGMGFSNGGTMASYVGQVAPGQGWPYNATVYHNSGGRSDQYGAAPCLDSVFIDAVYDTEVTPTDVQTQFGIHQAAGCTSQNWHHLEKALEPTRFARSNLISTTQSLADFKVVVNAGYYNKAGIRQFSSASIDSSITAIGNLAAFTPSRPGKGVLSVIHGTHVLNGEFATAEATYYWNRR